MTKKLLQISNDFADQKIYVNLVRHLSEQGMEQIVYVPVRWEDKIDGNRDNAIENVEYHYSYILKRSLLFKLRFHRKIDIIQIVGCAGCLGDPVRATVRRLQNGPRSSNRVAGARIHRK